MRVGAWNHDMPRLLPRLAPGPRHENGTHLWVGLWVGTKHFRLPIDYACLMADIVPPYPDLCLIATGLGVTSLGNG